MLIGNWRSRNIFGTRGGMPAKKVICAAHDTFVLSIGAWILLSFIGCSEDEKRVSPTAFRVAKTSQVSGKVDWKVRVESDTSWTGAFEGRTIDGDGNEEIDITDDNVGQAKPGEFHKVICIVVSKRTAGGFLKLVLIAGDKEVDNKETRAAFGVVMVCTP